MSTIDEALCSADNLPNVNPTARPDDWFSAPQSPAWNRAMAICMACPLYHACAEFAQAEGIPDGIYGGESAAERKHRWPNGKPPKDHLAGLYSQLDGLIGGRSGHYTRRVSVA